MGGSQHAIASRGPIRQGPGTGGLEVRPGTRPGREGECGRAAACGVRTRAEVVCSLAGRGVLTHHHGAYPRVHLRSVSARQRLIVSRPLCLCCCASVLASTWNDSASRPDQRYHGMAQRSVTQLSLLRTNSPRLLSAKPAALSWPLRRAWRAAAAPGRSQTRCPAQCVRKSKLVNGQRSTARDPRSIACDACLADSLCKLQMKTTPRPLHPARATL
jgi:hypothetical protein